MHQSPSTKKDRMRTGLQGANLRDLMRDESAIWYTEVDSDGCGNMCVVAKWSPGEWCCPPTGGGGSCPYGPCTYSGTYYDCCPIYPGSGG
jgi:hypothetical protein